MKRTIKLIALVMTCVIIATSFAACAKKRILVIDDIGDTSAAYNKTSEDEKGGSYGSAAKDNDNGTMPDDIFASPGTEDVGYVDVGMETEDPIVAEVFECVYVDGFAIQYIRDDPSVGYTYMVIHSFDPINNFYPAPSATDVIIPETVSGIGPVVAIGNDAFADSGIVSITIPVCVETIEESAFKNCTELTSVYYCGSELEWSLICVDINNDQLLSADRYYYSEEQPAESGNFWHYVDGVPTPW